MPSSPAVFGSGQIGFKSENAWGSAATVDKFVGFLPPETLKATQEYLKDESIRGSRRTLVTQKRGRSTVEGDITLNLPNVTVATLLHHMFGTIGTTGPVSSQYTHTASPGTLFGLGLTIQKGMPDSTGTVVPFTYAGCKVDNWELSSAIGEFVKLRLGITGKSETTGTALASASYASGYNPFTFVEASVEVPSGTSYPVHSFSLQGQNALKKDHFHQGSRVAGEQYDNGRMVYTASFNVDFLLADYTRVTAGTLLALKITLNNADSGGTDTLTFTCNGRFTGDSPTMSGPDAVEWDYTFECESTTSDATSISAVLVNADASAA